MKRVFTKIFSLVLLTFAGWALALTAQAQTFTETTATGGADDRVTALTTDKNGNVWAIVDPSNGSTSLLVEYVAATGSPVQKDSGIPINDSSVGNTIASLASDSHGNIYLSTNNPGTAAIIYKYDASNSYARSPLVTGSANIGYFEGMCVGPDDNLYVVQYNANGNTAGAGLGDFEVARYSTTSATANDATHGGTPLYTDLDHGFFAGGASDNYSHIVGMQVDKNGDIYVADGFDENQVYTATNGSNIYKLTHGSIPYAVSTVAANLHATALAMDATHTNLYASVSLTHTSTYSVVEFTGGTGSPTTLYTGLTVGGVNYPFGIAYVSDSELYVGDGFINSSNVNNLDIIFGIPTPASSIVFSNTTEKTTTISWTNGGGTNRAVFMALSSAGSISLTNGTTYTPSTTFGSGTAAGTGWSCVYNSTTSTLPLNISNLVASTGYKVMVVEYNGVAGAQNYATGLGTNNPNTFTTLANPSLTASGGTDSYNIGGTAATVDAGITVTAGQTNLSTATISVSTNPGPGDVLNFTNQNGITGSLVGSTLTLSGSSSVANYQTALRSITFTAVTSTSTRTISFTVGDGTANSNTVTKNITVASSTTISSLTAVTSTTTNAASVQYTATFAASITGLSTADFTLNTSGVSGASVTSVSGSGTSWTITVNTGSGSGTVQLSMNSASGVSPSVSNLPFNGATYTIDKTAPTVSSTTATLPSNTNPTNATSVTYTVTFSEAVTGVDASDFALTTSGTSGTVSVVSGSGTTYGVTVSSISGNGTLRLDLKSSGTGITDAVGNAISGGFTTGSVYTIDQTAPSVSSITATTPSNATTTNASSVTYTVTFSESVTGVDASDFALTTSGTSGSVSGVSGSGTTYTVTVSSITGSGTLRLDLKSSGTGITDGAGNAISGGFTTGDVYTIDRTAPTVSSIALAESSPTAATSVDYTVTFSEPVTGVTSGAFGLVTTSGNATGTINSVTAVSTSVYTVNVTGVSGNGGLRLDLSNVSGISDLNSNPLASGFTGSVYTIDNTPATLTSGSYFSNNLYSSQYAKVGDNLTLSVGYNEPLQSATMTIGGNSVPVSFSNSNMNFTGVYTITSSDVEGNVGWTLSATDLAGNVRNYTNNDFGTVLIFDKTPPAIAISAPSQATANSAATVNYTVSYSDANFNFSTLGTGDITLNTTGTAAATVGVSGSGTSYTVSISNITGAGTIGFSIGAGTAQDIPGNLALASDPSTTFTVDNTAPTVSSITATTPSNANPTNSTTLAYTVTFSEPVNNVDGSAFTGNNLTGTVSYSSITVSPVSSTVYTVTLNGISGDGTMRLDFANGGSTVQDPAGNAATAFSGGDVYTIDNTPPTAVTLVYSSNNANSQLVAKVGDVITIDFTTSETINTPTLSIAGHSVTAVNTTGNEWVGTYTMTSGDTEGRIPFLLSFTDLAGNPQPGNAYSDVAAGDDIEFDMTAPTAAIGAPSVASIGNNGSGSVTYTVTYADANFNSSSLTTGGITLNTTGTATGTVGVTGSGTSYTVTISSISGLGTLGISVAAGLASDNAGNTDAGAGPSTTFNVVNSDATLSALSLSKGTLSPVFSSGVTTYTAAVPYVTSTITVTATATDAGASVATTVNGTPASGSAPLNVGSNTIITTVTAADGITTKSYTVTVTRVQSENAFLSSISQSAGLLSPTFAQHTTTYTMSVGNSVASMTVTPVSTDPGATIKVNGSTVTSGAQSNPITLAPGTQTVISIAVTAPNGHVITYTITVTRAPNFVATLSNLQVSAGTPKPVFTPAIMSYNVRVTNLTTSIAITPTATDPNATITVNGTATASGTPATINGLVVGNNTVTIVVTAQDGTTKDTYTVIVNRPASLDCFLSSMNPSRQPLSPSFAPATTSYTLEVPNAIATMTLAPVTNEPNATMTINTTASASGAVFGPIALTQGPNTITVVVTAQDGVSQRTYTIIVTRDAPSVTRIANTVYKPISVEKPNTSPNLNEDGILVHQGISPNGDGLNDVLQIDNISQFPENKLSIMNRNGQLVYEAKGYDNSSKAFDGHSNKNGQMQLPGTYFYQLDYTVNGTTKHKTGFIVLKY